ncbi:7917_t:CDS:2 [Rhizophagus irregularis]|nr:7917_t:CDS:2 [Rhizophagus irregularis]
MRVEYNNSIQQKIIKRNWYRVIIIGILLSLQYIIPVDADPAEARWGHASALINNGTADSPNNDTSNVNELLYLDVSKSFNPAEPPWEIRNSLLVTGGQPPFLSFHSCSVGGNQNELLILFGGASREQDPEDNPLFEYNTTTGTWLNLAVTTANTPPRRSDHTIVTTSNSISYLWGGTPSEAEDTNIKALNQLYKLTTGDTISWELTTAQNSVGRWGHSATLLSDGKMYIIGGLSDGNILASMTEIPVYDTFREIWLSQTATGDTIPAQRRGHRAVGTEDNRIIIYGGTTAGRETYFDDIAVLKVVGDGLTWETHTVAGNQPPGRYDHSMTLVGSKAIVTYGLGNDFLDAGTKLFVFDIDSYTWEQTYNPSPSVMQNPSTVSNEATPTDMASMKTSSSNNNLGLIIGVSVAGGVAIIILLGLLFYYIRKRKRQPQFTSMPYEKQQASIPPIAGPAPLYNLNNFGPSSPSQGGAGGTTDNAPFIPPFASTSHQRQPSLGSLSETRNLTPVDQHDSLGSAPSNSSQSQLPQINIPYDSNIFPSNVAATGASSSTKTSSSNLRLDSDSNTAPVEFDFNLPPVAPLSFNHERTDGSFNSPLFRTEALSALAGTAAAASPTDRSLSLRSVPRLNTSTPRNSIGLSSPPPTSASSRLRSSTLEGLRTHDGSATNSSRPTSPTYTNTPDDQQPRGRLFVANPDPSDESD